MAKNNFDLDLTISNVSTDYTNPGFTIQCSYAPADDFYPGTEPDQFYPGTEPDVVPC